MNRDLRNGVSTPFGIVLSSFPTFTPLCHSFPCTLICMPLVRTARNNHGIDINRYLGVEVAEDAIIVPHRVCRPISSNV